MIPEKLKERISILHDITSSLKVHGAWATRTSHNSAILVGIRACKVKLEANINRINKAAILEMFFFRDLRNKHAANGNKRAALQTCRENLLSDETV